MERVRRCAGRAGSSAIARRVVDATALDTYGTYVWRASSPAVTRLAWLLTLVATAASTYALDAVATAAGLLLVATGVLGGAGHVAVLVFLTATYVAWGAGLSANLGANRRLLARTGTSTNALSKLASIWRGGGRRAASGSRPTRATSSPSWSRRRRTTSARSGPRW